MIHFPVQIYMNFKVHLNVKYIVKPMTIGYAFLEKTNYSACFLV